MRFILITGLSGAGKSRAANFLEDVGYFTVDNMPAVMIPEFVQLCMEETPQHEKVALVSDIRGGTNFAALFTALDWMKERGCDYTLLFLEASVPTIIRRYKETRRSHPLSGEGLSLEEAMQKEWALLAPVRARADEIIDSTNFATTAMLRSTLLERLGENANTGMSVSVMSFGFKYGLPLEADLIFDVRFLPNPFYIPELRKLTGLDQPVLDYLNQYPETQTFLDKLEEMLSFLLPLYAKEGKTALTIAVGCTGGQHRSVALCHGATVMVRGMGFPVTEHHRDIARDRK
ncbi:MAG: RNase adapter RapZ [Clostridiales bacterium]|nr:RNase adapter RapZ [Clostridiales bacterium]